MGMTSRLLRRIGLSGAGEAPREAAAPPAQAPAPSGAAAAKARKLAAFVESIPAAKAIQLAKAIETMQSQEASGFPSAAILEALRARIRKDLEAKFPATLDAALAPLVDFTVEGDFAGVVPGRIPQRRVRLWRTTISQIRSRELALLEAERARLLEAGDEAAWPLFAEKARAAVAHWAAGLSAEIQAGGALSGVPRGQLTDLGDRADFVQIANVLRLGSVLGDAIRSVHAAAADSGQTAGDQILELTDAAVLEAKRRYAAIVEGREEHGAYLALGLMNRLARPWHILRLARALSWTRRETMVAATEFAVIGERLLHEILELARRLDAGMPGRGRRGAPLDTAALAALVRGYAEAVKGFVDELDVRRDSPWGETLFKSRATVRDALDSGRLDPITSEVLRILPQADRPDAAADEEDLQKALSAADFLACVAACGDRHGFGVPARASIDALWQEIDLRTGRLLDDLRKTPGDGAKAASLHYAVKVTSTLFSDDRAETIARRLNMVLAGPEEA